MPLEMQIFQRLELSEEWYSQFRTVPIAGNSIGRYLQGSSQSLDDSLPPS